MDMYKAGTLKKGDQITFTLEGLCDAKDNSNKYNSDGKLSLTFVAAEKPLELVAANNVPNGNPTSMTTFNSWYMPNDESGVVTLKFDGEVNMEADNMPKARLTYGDIEKENGLYIEDVEVKAIDNNTIAIDFRNKLRRHKDMLTIDETFTVMTLSISNVHGKDGQYSYSSGSSSIGSYAYVYDYKEVKYMVMSDFTPYTSSSKPAPIDGVKNIEIWLSEDGARKMTYSGVWFITTYEGKQDTTLVEKNDLQIEADPTDATATIINVAVPELNADENSNVIVTLADVITPDGVDHSNAYTAVYYTSGSTGIENISTDMGNNDVYGIDGILIKKNADASDIKNLKKGTYIINKKKVCL